jgi:hypothetical protein
MSLTCNLKVVGRILLLLVIAVAITLCSGCSGEYHLRKAYEKGALKEDSTTQVSSDTIIKKMTGYEVIEIPYEKVITKDSIYCDSNNLPVLVKGYVKGDSLTKIKRQLRGNILTITAERDSLKRRIEYQYDKIMMVTTQVTNLKQINSELTEELRKANEEARLTWYEEGLMWIGGAFLVLLAVALGVKVIRKSIS